jgi:guanylate kinase
LGAAIARLIVISGPSGSGKGTVIKGLMARVPDLILSISATTRELREGEQEGREYHFLTEDEFKSWIRKRLFLEWADYTKHLYGTPRKPVTDALEAGHDVILEIELKGAKQVLAKCPGALMFYIMPPSLEELERRLRGRGTETEKAIQDRLARAKVEMALVNRRVRRGLPPLHYVILNDSAERASDQLAGIIKRIRDEDEQADHR